jgi:hypothetical protein
MILIEVAGCISHAEAPASEAIEMVRAVESNCWGIEQLIRWMPEHTQPVI